MYPKMGYKKTMYPMYPKLGYKLGYMGEISQQSFLVETMKKNLCLKNWNFLGKNLKNRGLGAKNQKSTSNISKLEYFEAFYQKIQKLKIFVKKPKNHIFRGPKMKNSPFALFSPFFVQNGHPLFTPLHRVKSSKMGTPTPKLHPHMKCGGAIGL